MPGPSRPSLAQAPCPALAQPSPAQARPKPGPGWKSGDLEIWEFGIQKNPKNKILKIKIRSAQNVGEVFHAGKKRPRPIWGPPGNFFAWAGKIQKILKF